MCKNAKTKKQYVVPCYLWLLVFSPSFFWEPFPKIEKKGTLDIEKGPKSLNRSPGGSIWKQYVIFFAKIRALYGENTDKILVHVQSVIDLFAKQLNNALNLHYVYHQNTGVIRAIFHKCP